VAGGRGSEGRGSEEGTSIINLFLRDVTLAAGGHVDLKLTYSTDDCRNCQLNFHRALFHVIIFYQTFKYI
jgi:hypothetical protein